MTNTTDIYSEQTRKVLSSAKEEAQRMNNPCIWPEHILIALLREDKDKTARIFSNLKVELDQILSAIDFTFGRGEKPFLGELELASSTLSVIDLALDEAHDFGHSHIGTDHLLLGLLSEESIIASLLGNLGITYDRVKAEIN